MTEPSQENEEKAFVGLLGAVAAISVFFYFTKELESTFPRLLQAIAKASDPEAIPLALCVQLAHILDFSLRFDQVPTYSLFVCGYVGVYLAC